MTLDRRQFTGGAIALSTISTATGSGTARANPILATGLIAQALRAFVTRSIAARVAGSGISQAAKAAIGRSVASITGRGYSAKPEWIGQYGGDFLTGVVTGAGEAAGKWAIEALRGGAGVVAGEGTIGNTEDVAVAEFPNSSDGDSCRLAWPDIYSTAGMVQRYLRERERLRLPGVGDGDLLVHGLYPCKQIEFPSHDRYWHSIDPTVFWTPFYEIRIYTYTTNVDRPHTKFMIFDNYLKMIKFQSTISLPETYVVLR